MMSILAHYVDRYPKIQEFLAQLPPNPARDSHLDTYRRLAAAHAAAVEQLGSLAADLQAVTAQLGSGDLDPEGSVDRYVLLSARKEHLPPLRERLVVLIGEAQASWAVLARQDIDQERSRRRALAGTRFNDLEPQRQRLKRFGSKSGLQGNDLEHYCSLEADLATLEPLHASEEEAALILRLLDDASSERFSSPGHLHNGQGIHSFTERVAKGG